jgi:hypothetical protein
MVSPAPPKKLPNVLPNGNPFRPHFCYPENEIDLGVLGDLAVSIFISFGERNS